jgi:hypothetical protein
MTEADIVAMLPATPLRPSSFVKRLVAALPLSAKHNAGAVKPTFAGKGVPPSGTRSPDVGDGVGEGTGVAVRVPVGVGVGVACGRRSAGAQLGSKAPLVAVRSIKTFGTGVLMTSSNPPTQL